MELFRLLGKIAVDNAEAKKALQETSQEGEKTESKLGKVFGAMGKGAAIAGKAIATGLVAGITAMAGLTAKTLQTSGELEQNMGGAEAVFGELGKAIGDMETPMQRYDAATGKVITETANLEKVSKDAYKNMGLSQSDYLATANKMGALFKGAGFETQEALDLSANAMQRAADVASIMGIDTSAAMEAVAGAAKGNFTMMDNLGVAMNDTAIGAYALEKGINKSTSEMTQQEKIGLAMEMFMEKTSYAAGNYAKENETLAGSLGTAKAALTNFLAGSGDVESLVSSFSGLANVVVRSLKDIVPRLTTGLTDIVNQIAPMLPGLLEQLLPVLIQGATSLVNGLVAALPGVISALMNALPMLIDGFMLIVDALIGALPTILESIVNALPTVIPQLIDAAVNLFMMLVEMLPQIIQPIIDALPTIIIAITDALLSNLPVLLVGVGQLIVALAAAIPQILGALWEAIKGIFTTLGEKILGFFDPVKEAISNAWEAMGNVPGLAQLKTMIENVWGAIKSHISTVINAIKNVVSTVWNSIKNVVSTVLNSIKNVIQTAWNAVKTIISNVMKLISSVLKGDWEGVKKAISNILNAIKSVIKSIWDGIKNTISSVLNGIKNVVSSVWNGIKSVISSALNGIKTVVSSVWNGIKGAISNVLKGIVNTVKGGAKDMLSAGKDLIKGIWKGISNSLDWIKGKVKGWVGNVTKFIKKLFGIKSPSTVMRDQVGRELAAGVAVGIEQNISKVQEAAEEMNQKVLDAAQKRIDDYKVYNNMTLAEEAGFWDEVRQQIAEGTDARIKADQKYLEAKKAVDDQILTAEQTLQSELDEIAKKVTDRQKTIMETFDLFGSFNPEESGFDPSTELLLDLDAQISAMERYNAVIDNLESRIGGSALFEELKSMGVDSVGNLQHVANMTDAELQMYSKMFDEKLALAGKMAKEELAPETLAETQKAYEKFATTCSEMGVDISTSIADSMGNAVTSVSNSLDLIKQAFEAFAVNFDFSAFTSAPTLSSDSVVYSINSATADGSGSEQTKTGTLSDVFAAIVEQKNMMQKLIEMLTKFFPELIEAFDVDLYVNGRKFATELAPDMNVALGRISGNTERGR